MWAFTLQNQVQASRVDGLSKGIRKVCMLVFQGPRRMHPFVKWLHRPEAIVVETKGGGGWGHEYRRCYRSEFSPKYSPFFLNFHSVHLVGVLLVHRCSCTAF